MLKEECFRFQHDILLIGRPVSGPAVAPSQEEEHADLLRRDRALLAGRVAASHEGNILEAMNLALNPFDEHYIDRDLNRTGLDLVIITAGTGHFRVNKHWLRMTTERMIDNGIGLDLICLTKMPLHSVPLFHFDSQVPEAPVENPLPSARNQRGQSQKRSEPPSSSSAPPDPLYFDAVQSHATHSSLASRPLKAEFFSIPHWIDASFYNLQQDQPFRADRFVPRVKMKEIQQIGYMENEISDISLPYLDLTRTAVNRAGFPSSFGALSSRASGDPGTASGTKMSGAPKGLEALVSRAERRALRERFDREMFRDLEAVIPSSRAISKRSQLSSSGRELGSYDSARSNDTPSSRAATRGGRFGRDSYRSGPRLESHAEHDDAAEASERDGARLSRSQSPGDSRQPLKAGPLPSTPSQSSSQNHRYPNEADAETPLAKHVGPVDSTHTTPSHQVHSRSSSRPSSVYSLRSMPRPLQPLGKTEALVAPSQAQDLVADLLEDSDTQQRSPQQQQSNGSPATAPTSPTQEGVGFPGMSQRSFSAQITPHQLRSSTRANGAKGNKFNAGWLWRSLTRSDGLEPDEDGGASTAAGDDTGSRRPSLSPSPHRSPSQTGSAASLRIQALLKRSGGSVSPLGTKPPPAGSVRSDRALSPLSNAHSHSSKDDHQQDSKGESSDASHHIPISIPSNSGTSSSVQQSNKEAGWSKSGEGVESKINREQDAYEQGLEDEEARARYAQRAQIEKQTLVNPSNPRKSMNSQTVKSQLLRWQHLYPRRLNRHVVKWRSITTPACLPLTTFYLPTPQELAEEWAEYPHTLSISSDLSSFLVKRTSSTAPALAALKEMTSQRLAQGFQFIVPMTNGGTNDEHEQAGDERESESRAVSSRRFGPSGRGSSFTLKQPTELFQPGTLTSGNPILLGLSNQVHRLTYDRAAGAINVERYIRKVSYDTSPITYRCCIWPRHLPGYQTVQATFRYPDFSSYDWTYLDSLITGHAEQEKLTEGLRYWRTRLVIVPTEGPAPPMTAPSGEQLNDEEIRLIGMDRLADLFARSRWKARSHGSGSGAAKTAAANALLRFIPTSLDPSMSMHDDEFMRQMEAAIVEDEQVEEAAQLHRAANRAKRQIKDASLDSITLAMASERHGMKIQDRFWNRNNYASVFTGSDLTTWFVLEYADVRTREESVEVGERLMKEGLFEHVHGTHGFLDGHYFYRFKGDWAKKASAAARSSRSRERSNGAQGGKAGLQPLSSSASGRDRSSSGDAIRSSSTSHRRIKMSRSLIIDVDHGRKSDRAETAFLHYDISHNPANGFNAQLHWLGTTARFIEDTVQNWTRTLERYGLRLIEAPIGQICDVGKHNPFQAPVPIHLSLAPPAPSSYAHLLPEHVNAEEYFEWALLRRLGFVLDQEAAKRYPDDVEIIYQSRPSRFEYSQFVHRSGIAFVQVVGGHDGFLWLNNRLFNSHMGGGGASGGGNSRVSGGTNGGLDRHGNGKRGGGGRGGGGGGGNNREESGGHSDIPDPDRARSDFEAVCADPLALHAFYVEVLAGMQEAAVAAGKC